MNEIYFDKEAKEKLYLGIEKLYKAVSSTMGPNGKTVAILDSYNKPTVTKDGVSVARAIQFKDFVENAGAELIKQAAEKTLNDAGDGTTTATVLAYHLINNLKEFNFLDVNKALDEIIPKVINELRKNSRKLEHKDIKYVASVSANNDKQIGELIQNAFNFTNIIKVEESNSDEDILENTNGMLLENVTYFSKHFITNEAKGEVYYNDSLVLILDGKLDKLDFIKNVLDYCYTNNKAILIITEHIGEAALRMLETLKLSNGLKICAIKTPGHGPYRKDLLDDLSIYTKSNIIHNFSNVVNISNLGKLESFTINKNNSILVKHEEINVSSRIENLVEFSKSLEGYEKDLIERRINQLSGKVSLIKVGGRTPAEMKERKDRIDDAVLAVQSALEEGIVEGGGFALMGQAMSILDNFPEIKFSEVTRGVRDSLSAPYKTIINNGTPLDYKLILENNIIDPLKVTRCALENAVSVAKTILSTNTVILNEYLWNK